MKMFGFEIRKLPTKKQRLDALEKQNALLTKNLEMLTKILENGNK
jgi:hypothetical protein